MQTVPSVLGGVVVQLALGEERRGPQFRQVVEQDPAFRFESDLTEGPATSIHPVQEPLDLILGADAFLDLPRCEMQLVGEAGQKILLDGELQGLVLGRWREIRRADGEDVGDQLRVVLRCAVDDRSAPVVAAEDDGLAAELVGQLGDVVAHASVAVVPEGVGRCVGPAVAHAVRCDDSEAEGEEEGDLVAPAHG